MSFFDFFKKEATPTIKDLVWMNHSSKLKGSVKLLEGNPEVKMIAWFPETAEDFRKYFLSEKIPVPEIILAKNATSSVLSSRLLFLEHYPIRSKEENLMSRLTGKEIVILNSLDEPLFDLFGGEKIIELMSKMGIKEEDSMEHSLISKSIANAQRKLEKKVIAEMQANSSREWFKKNLSA